MLRFRTLGSLDLVDGQGNAILSVLAQPKRVALLAYLAAERPSEFKQRETLTALLWPESPEASARHSLRQALYKLRQSLGAHAVETRGSTEVRVAPDSIATDVVEFEHLIAQRRWAEALDCYGGSFLEGLHIDAASSFEKWVDGRQSQLRRAAAQAGWAVALDQAKRGAVPEVERTAARILAIDPAGKAAALELAGELRALGLEAAASRVGALVGESLPVGLEVTGNHSARPRPGAARAARDPAALAGAPNALTPPSPRSRRPAWLTAAIVVGALVVASGAMGVVRWAGDTGEPDSRTRRFEIVDRRTAASPVLSGDGAILVSAPNPDGVRQLWIKSPDQADFRPIAGTEGSLRYYRPAGFSPDGDRIAFLAQNELRVTDRSGAQRRTLADSAFCCPTWDTGGRIYFTGSSGEIRSVSATGGPVETVTALGPDELGPHSDLVILPGRTAALFYNWNAPGSIDTREPRVEALDLASGRRRELVRGARPSLGPNGGLIYWEGNRLLIDRFDPETQTVEGRPRVVEEEVRATDAVYPTFALSPSGTLVYLARRADEYPITFAWVSRSGTLTPVDPEWAFSHPQHGNFGFRLSPDGTKVATWSRDETNNRDVWVKELSSGPFYRLTHWPGIDGVPRWTPSGDSVLFISPRGGRNALWSKAADGSGEPHLVTDLADNLSLGFWTPAKDWLVLRVSGAANSLHSRDVVAIAQGENEVEPLVATPAVEEGPAVSPDGLWLAYSSDETGQREVYVRPFPNVDAAKIQVSSQGGFRPRWAHSGRELYYVTPERDMVAVALGPGGSPATDPQVLFRFPQDAPVQPNADFYDVSPIDGRFLISVPFTPPSGNRMIVVQHWYEEFREIKSP